MDMPNLGAGVGPAESEPMSSDAIQRFVANLLAQQSRPLPPPGPGISPLAAGVGKPPEEPAAPFGMPNSAWEGMQDTFSDMMMSGPDKGMAEAGKSQVARRADAKELRAKQLEAYNERLYGAAKSDAEFNRQREGKHFDDSVAAAGLGLRVTDQEWQKQKWAAEQALEREKMANSLHIAGMRAGGAGTEKGVSPLDVYGPLIQANKEDTVGPDGYTLSPKGQEKHNLLTGLQKSGIQLGSKAYDDYLAMVKATQPKEAAPMSEKDRAAAEARLEMYRGFGLSAPGGSPGARMSAHAPGMPAVPGAPSAAPATSSGTRRFMTTPEAKLLKALSDPSVSPALKAEAEAELSARRGL